MMSSGGSLVVAGTGIQWAGHSTPAARGAIERADQVLFAVADPWTVRWIRQLNPRCEPLPYPLDGSLRRATYRDMEDRILAYLRQGLRVCAVFYGHPGVLTTPSRGVIARARQEGFNARLLPGISALDCLFADLGCDPGLDGCQIYEATDFLIRPRRFDSHTPLVLCQVGYIGGLDFYDRAKREQIRTGLCALTDALTRRFPPDHEVTVYEAAMLPTQGPRIAALRLDGLVDAEVSDLSTLWVPAVSRAALDETMMHRLGMTTPGSVRGSQPTTSTQ